MPKQQIAWKPLDLIVLHNKSANSLLLQLPTGSQRLDRDHMILTEAQILQVPAIKTLVDSGTIEVLNRKAYPSFRETRGRKDKGTGTEQQ